MRIGNMHSAVGKASPMPTVLEQRDKFKGELLVKSLEITRAFASPQGIQPSIVGGDFNMPFGDVDATCRRELNATHGRWEISDRRPSGQRDFLFANTEVEKLSGCELCNHEGCTTWLQQ